MFLYFVYLFFELLVQSLKVPGSIAGCRLKGEREAQLGAAAGVEARKGTEGILFKKYKLFLSLFWTRELGLP